MLPAMGPEPTMTSRPCRVLMVYPKFVPNSFWNYTEACKLVGARYPAAPLGLITVAALLPQDWEFRLVNRNTEELDAGRYRLGRHGDDRRHAQPAAGLLAPDRALPRSTASRWWSAARTSPRARTSTSRPTSRCSARPRTSSRISSPPGKRGERKGVFTGREIQDRRHARRRCRVSICSSSTSISTSASSIRAAARSPASSATSSSFMAACRAPRPTTQILAELQTLYRARLSRPCRFRRRQPDRQQEGAASRSCPSSSSGRKRTTIRSNSRPRPRINLADDDELLELHEGSANFFAGVRRHREPGPRDAGADAQEAEHPAQHRREHPQNLRYGIFVTAGFIVGFDSEKGSHRRLDGRPSSRIARCRSPWSACSMRCPARSSRAASTKEGRLHAGHDVMRDERAGDQCTLGINFDPMRPMRDILTDYKRVLETRLRRRRPMRGRLERLAVMLDRRGPPRDTPGRAIAAARPGSIETVHASSTPCRERAKYSGDTFKTMRPNQSACAALHRHADGDLHASRPVLAPRDRYHRPAHRRDRRRRRLRRMWSRPSWPPR